MLKMTGSPDKPASGRNNSSKLASGRNNGDGGVDKFGSDCVEHAKKSGKSKEPKLAKSQKLSKSGKCKGKKSKKQSKSENSHIFGVTEFEPSFLTPKARLAFNYLRVSFMAAPILRHYDLECQIQIKTDASGYAISGVLSQQASGTSPDGLVTKTNLSQWHPVAFFSRKMISAETEYQIHNGKLLAIVKVFKTWRHYLKGCKHEFLVLTDHNILCCFMDTKSLSSKQVHWAQEISSYHY